MNNIFKYDLLTKNTISNHFIMNENKLQFCSNNDTYKKKIIDATKNDI